MQVPESRHDEETVYMRQKNLQIDPESCRLVANEAVKGNPGPSLIPSLVTQESQVPSETILKLTSAKFSGLENAVLSKSSDHGFLCKMKAFKDCCEN